MGYNVLSINNLPRSSKTGKGGTGTLMKWNTMFCLRAGQPHYVLVTPKSTNTQLKSTKGTSMDTQTTVTQQKSTLKNSQTSTYLLEDFLAKHSQSLESVEDLTTPEAHSFLTSLGFSQKKDPDIWYSKTSKVYLVTTLAKLSRQYLGFSPTWGIELNGKYLTAKTSEFPKTESESSLSDILEENVDNKYYLSEKVKARLLKSVFRSDLEIVHDPSGLSGTLKSQGERYKVGLPLED